MKANPDYTGTHKVVLPADFMNSLEAVCEVHEEHIVAVGANLDIPGMQVSPTQKFVRFAVAVVGIWLIPVVWLTCL